MEKLLMTRNHKAIISHTVYVVLWTEQQEPPTVQVFSQHADAVAWSRLQWMKTVAREPFPTPGWHEVLHGSTVLSARIVPLQIDAACRDLL